MLYKIENKYLIAYISDLGATLVKLIDKKSEKDIYQKQISKFI